MTHTAANHLNKMKVSDLMNIDVLTLNPHDTLVLVDDITRLGKVRHLPVIDKDEKVIGLVSHRDFVKACPSHMADLGKKEQEEFLNSVTVDNIMIPDVYTVGPEVLLSTAAGIMLKNRYGCLPVIERGNLVGIITEADFVRFFQRIAEEG